MRKKKGNKKPNFKPRLYIIIGIFAIFFAAIFLRAFQLQILENDKLKKLALRQHRKTVNIQSKRGDIYDRNLKELAISIEVDSIYAQPGKVESPRVVSKALAPLLQMDKDELEKKLKSSGNFVWLKRQVDLNEEQRKIVAEFDGIGITKESRRYYPNRQLASNVIGFTGLDANGLEGVELHYDEMLKGVSRKFVSDKDAAGRLLVFEDLEKTVPVQGMVVELTVDKAIQYIAEKALKKAVDSSGAKGGTALVMDPSTGEILAMASVPTFDPNDFNTSTPKQWRNKAITDIYEPGSIFKLFLISAALEENVVKPTDSVYCENGSYRVADRVFHDHGSYGWLTVPQVIKYSSNIGSAKIGEKLGRNQLYRYLKAFGFGNKSGIDLPGEASGVLRPLNTWSSVTLETISFGQGVSASGLQLVTALSAIANGGFLMKPYIVKTVKDQNGAVVSETSPTIVRRVVSEETARKITSMMIGVTQEGGTGTKAALEEFEVAGKTGTAQKPDFKRGGYMEGAFMASFMGFVPARNPRLAILVSIDEPRGDYFGGSISGPVFKEIAKESLSYLGVFKENTNAPKVQFVKNEGKDGVIASAVASIQLQKEAAPEEDDAHPMAVPDFTGKTVRAVLKTAKKRSFEVEINGSGRAVSQKPLPGQNIPSKGPVVVYFQ